MSHVISWDVRVTDLEALGRAVRRMGGTLEHRPHVWYGRWVGDSPVPRDLFATEEEYRRVLAMPKTEECAYMTELLGSSEYAVKFPQYQYEVGVHRVGDHHALSLDWWGDIKAMRGSTDLIDLYTVEKVKLEAEREGWGWTEERLDNGKYVVEMTQW